MRRMIIAIIAEMLKQGEEETAQALASLQAEIDLEDGAVLKVLANNCNDPDYATAIEIFDNVLDYYYMTDQPSEDEAADYIHEYYRTRINKVTYDPITNTYKAKEENGKWGNSLDFIAVH